MLRLYANRNRLSMADFIESLGDCIESATNAAFRLRMSLARIDQAISQAIQNESPRSIQSQQASAWASQSNLTDDDHTFTAAMNFFPYENLEGTSPLAMIPHMSPLDGFVYSPGYQDNQSIV